MIAGESTRAPLSEVAQELERCPVRVAGRAGLQLDEHERGAVSRDAELIQLVRITRELRCRPALFHGQCTERLEGLLQSRARERDRAVTGARMTEDGLAIER